MRRKPIRGLTLFAAVSDIFAERTSFLASPETPWISAVFPHSNVVQEAGLYTIPGQYVMDGTMD
jgi:hypothetical protein